MPRRNKNALQGHYAKRKGRRKKKKTPPWNARARTDRELID